MAQKAQKKKAKKVLVTGSAGFIGFHTAEALLKRGYTVVGVDSMVPYYDVRMKEKRNAILKKYPAFTFYKKSIADYKTFKALVQKEKPDEIIHLAAQAGVRYSLTNPWAYAESNYLGTLNVFEAARWLKLPRVVYASSSSVYGANEESPFSESHRTDRQISLYAATKKANEVLAHAYNHLFGIEMIGLRFFTVYGIWGRPDLALFKFVKRILRGQTIELYNRGKMKRCFTYVDDVVNPIIKIIESRPQKRNELYNIGGAESVSLTHFVELIETNLGKKAKKKLTSLQAGDVPETLADCSKLAADFGYRATVSMEQGIAIFVDWFKQNEAFLLSLKEPQQ
jgi:UDP-glucuronate 4-epimerase